MSVGGCLWATKTGFCEKVTNTVYCEAHQEWGAAVDKKIAESDHNEAFKIYRTNLIKAINSGTKYGICDVKIFNAMDYCDELMYGFEKQRFDKTVRQNIVLDYFDCKYDNTTGIVTYDGENYKLNLVDGRGKIPDVLYKRTQSQKEILNNITLEFIDERFGSVTYNGKRGVLGFEVFNGTENYTNEMAIVF